MKNYCNYCLVLTALGAALGLSHAGFGQIMSMPSYVPPPNMNWPMNPAMYGTPGVSLAHRDGAGSYQLSDGSWHKGARLVFDGERLTVRDSTAGKQRFTSETVQQLVVTTDTFLVVRNLPGRPVPPPRPDFLCSVFNRRGIRLLALYRLRGQPTYFLSRPHTSLQLLPSDKKAFKTAMLAIVKDAPVLSAKVASGALGRDEVGQIVQEYVDFLALGLAVK